MAQDGDFTFSCYTETSVIRKEGIKRTAQGDMAAAIQAVLEISHVILSLTGFWEEFRHI